MSVIAMEIAEDGIIVAADGVSYEYDTGALRGYVSKLIVLPDLDCVIGVTGVGDLGRALYLEIGDWFQDFDQFADNFEDVCRNVHHEFMLRGDLYDHPTKRADVSIVIAGWSNRHKAFKGYRVFSYAKESRDLDTGAMIEHEPWTSIPIPSYWASMLPNQESLNACGLSNPSGIPAGEFAPRVVCAARASSGKMPDDAAGNQQIFNAGGFLQMVHLQRGDIRSWIAHRWPEDEIGEPVDPTKGELLPDWLKAEEAA